MTSVITRSMGKMTMASGSPSSTVCTPSEYDIKSNKYEKVIDSNAAIKPFTSKTKSNQKVVYVGWFKTPIPGLSEVVKQEWKCAVCASRSMNLSRILGKDSQHFCAHTYATGSDIRNDIQIAANKLTQTAWKDSPSNWSLRILPHPDDPYHSDGEFDVRELYTKSKGYRSNGESFNHYYLNISNTSKLCPRVSDAEIDNALLQKALDKYTPLLRQFIKRTVPTESDYVAIRKSFDVFKKIIDKVPYASVLNHGISFMNVILSHSDMCGAKQPCYLTESQLMNVIGNTIISSTVSPGENGDAIITAFHQLSKNVLDLIVSAVSEEAMVRMCRDRFDPTKYEQPTAAPSLNKVAHTLNTLGDYSVSLCTLDELCKHIPDTVKLMGDISSGPSGGAAAVMGKMMNSYNTKSKYNFADRYPKANEGQSIDSIKTLVEHMNLGYVKSLEIKCANHGAHYTDPTSINTVYFGTFHNFNPAHLITNALWGWGFINEEAPRFHGRHKVSHVVPFAGAGWKNYAFILDNSRTCPKINGSVSWPGILAPGVRRIHGSTFKEVGSKMPINYPEGNLAIGVGVSEPNTSSKLNRTITVYINGNNTPINISMGGMH